MARRPRELTSIIDVRATIPRNYREDHDRTFIYAETTALLLDPNALGATAVGRHLPENKGKGENYISVLRHELQKYARYWGENTEENTGGG